MQLLRLLYYDSPLYPLSQKIHIIKILYYIKKSRVVVLDSVKAACENNCIICRCKFYRGSEIFATTRPLISREGKLNICLFFHGCLHVVLYNTVLLKYLAGRRIILYIHMPLRAI